MADFRLLIVLILAISTSGCAPIVSPALAGRVVDAATGEPIPGAEVFTEVHVVYRFAISGASFDWRYTTADGEGRFSFPRQRSEEWLNRFFYSVEYPSLSVAHREYGNIPVPIGKDPNAWLEIVARIEPIPWEVEAIRKARPTVVDRDHTCSGLPSRRCCDVLFSRPDLCAELEQHE